MPGLAPPATALAIAAATSPTNTGWNRVRPPPINGRTGETRAIAPKRLKKSSSEPNTIEGRKIVAPGTAASTASSPFALLRA